jgi:hypothetical protein
MAAARSLLFAAAACGSRDAASTQVADASGSPTDAGPATPSEVSDGGLAPYEAGRGDDDATPADAGSSLDGSPPSDAQPAAAPDASSVADSFLTTYVAGTMSSGPGGINGSAGLTSSANQVALTSLSDLVVAGGEQTNSHTFSYDIYRFRGIDGSLVWKYASYSQLELLGLDAHDTIYAVAAGIYNGAPPVTVLALDPAGTVTRTSAPILGGSVNTGGAIGGCVLDDGTVLLAGTSTAEAGANASTVLQRMLPDGSLDWMTSLTHVVSPGAQIIPLSSSTAIVLLADETKPVDPDLNGAPMLGTLDIATGAVTTVTIALPASVSAVPGAVAVGAVPGPSGDMFVLLASGWLLDVLPTGAVQSSVLVHPTLTGFTGTFGATVAYGVARTAEGLMVVGSANLTGSCSPAPGCASQQPVAERYDLKLTDLGAYPTQTALAGNVAEWTSIASRDGAVALAGTFLRETILLGKTHY